METILSVLCSWDTTQDTLLRYFSRFGEVIDCVVMKNADTGRSRGFGFVTYSDPINIEAVLASCPHTLDGRTIDPKACNPRSMQKPKNKAVTMFCPKVRYCIFATPETLQTAIVVGVPGRSAVQHHGDGLAFVLFALR